MAVSMIVVDGRHWGTATEIAAHLGHGVTAKTVRRWYEDRAIPGVRTADENGRPQVRHPLDEAVRVEAEKRNSARSRRR
jgi:hypothetical protein